MKRLVHSSSILAMLLLFLPAIVIPPANAQSLVLLEELKAKQSAIEASTTQDDKTRARISELYGQAIQASTETIKVRANLLELQSTIKSAPKQLEKIHKQLAKKPQAYNPVKKLRNKTSIDEVAGLLRQEEEEFETLKASLKRHSDELNQLLDAVAKQRELIADRSGKLERINADLDATTPPEESPALTTARKDALLARKALLSAELELYRLKTDNHELLTNLAAAERDFALRETNRLLPGLEALRIQAQELREASAAKVMEEAERAHEEAADLPAPVRVIAEKNVLLSTELQELTRREAQVVEQLDSVHRRLDDIKSEADSTRQRVEIVGPSEAIGRMLRKRAEELPSLGSYRRDTSKRRAEINLTTDRQIDIDEMRRDLLDIEQRIQDTLSQLEQPDSGTTGEEKLSTQEHKRLYKQTRLLLNAQRDSLLELHKVYGRYVGQLTALDLAEKQLVDEAEKFMAFIDERLIWIRSTQPISFGDASNFISGIIWLASPSNWIQIAGDFFANLRADPGRSLLGLMLVLSLLALRRSSIRQIHETANLVKTIRTDSYWLTLRALAHTLLVAASWPALLLFIAWGLSTGPTTSTDGMAIAEGFYAAGAMLATIGFFRYACRADGLGERHFRWPKKIRVALLRDLAWLQTLLPPLVFIIAAAMETTREPYIQGLGRPAFLVMMILLLYFVTHALRSSGPIQTHLRAKEAKNRLTQIRLIWLPIATLVPLLMMLASGLGYHHTALIMEHHVQSMVWFFLGLMVLRDLLLRALYLAEMKFRYEEALKKRDELRAQREKEALSDDEEKPLPTIEPPEVECEEINYGQLSEQAKRLLHTGLFLGAALGLWVIWADMLPVFGVLEAVTLPFTTLDMIDGIEKVVPVTLADLILALLFIAITIIAAKNLPGLMEIIFLQRLPLDPGARYAIKALTQYLIVAIGIITAFNAIGAEWSRIQWLIAALSVGLGFGLQEIVANFISGIILLFERPIRVGDTVTVGDTTGKVSRIRIRATTILNWDKQELLVPNKEFITGRLLNWTLTDQMIRIIIPVGIAYGSDVDKALSLMGEVAAENDYVLKDPEPLLTFEDFGDNALVLNLRCYLGSLEHWQEIKTDLRKAINRKFNTAGIVIAFPQRDIHLDTEKPLDIRIHQGTGTISP